VARGRPSTDLERLWAGEFGDAYADRNSGAGRGRDAFWTELLERLRPASVLEVGCNVGGNLEWIASLVGTENVAGVDVNEGALETLRARVPGVDARQASGRSLPFGDRRFELVFTIGVLIHQGAQELRPMMREIVRCSARYVLCGEYFAEQEVEVPYREISGALFKRDYGGLYLREFPELALLDTGTLARADEHTWDDVTWWLLEKRAR
jgi:spore coat polysaccharide biosynthesis protein SpsF